jgi:MFS family permease
MKNGFECSDTVRVTMTSCDQADETAPRPPAGRIRAAVAPYADIFSVPHAWQFSVAGMIGRMPMATFGLGTVLFISAVTGHYGIAGSVSAAGSLGYAIITPQAGRLTDRLGQRRVLLPLVAVFAVSSLMLILTVTLRTPDWVWFIPGVLAGATMPSLGSMVRARWSTLLQDSPRLHTAFSYESVADEMCFIVGPAAVTLLATQLFSAAGVVASALLCVGGCLWFASQRVTEPPPAAARPAGSVRDSRLAARGLAVLIPGYLLLGSMFVSVDLSTVAFAQHTGHKSLAGFVLGTYALGSATGGLWYGSRHWHAPVHRRFALTLTLTVTGVCTFWAQPSLLALTCVIYLCGMTIAPTLIAGFSLVEAQAPADRRTEAMSWLSTGISIGVAIGATIVGFVIDAHGPRWGYVFAACCGASAALTCLLGLRRLRVPS